MTGRGGCAWKRKGTPPQEEPEQIGSFKNSQRKIPACSSRKLRENGIAKVPAGRSGLIPLISRGFSDRARFSFPPWATALVKLTESSGCCRMTSFKGLTYEHVTCKFNYLAKTRGEKFKLKKKVRSSLILPSFPSTEAHRFWKDVFLKAIFWLKKVGWTRTEIIWMCTPSLASECQLVCATFFFLQFRAGLHFSPYLALPSERVWGL